MWENHDCSCSDLNALDIVWRPNTAWLVSWNIPSNLPPTLCDSCPFYATSFCCVL
jgi:hypothetical protein